MPEFRFSQLNVFSASPLAGNPLAVVHGADSLKTEEMASLARWTNLSETTFLLSPTDPNADYRVRIFTPAEELPFAGHPTLGSCHGWITAGGEPRSGDFVIQECGAGLVRVKRDGARYAFSAPPLLRSGPIDEETLGRIAASLSLERSEIQRHQWIDNGPGWCAIQLDTARSVLALKPDWALLGDLKLGVVGPQPSGQGSTFEVRSFVGGANFEDPATGSLNAGLAEWLMRENIAPSSYVASQGSALDRAGRIYLSREEDGLWVGGDVCEVIRGTIDLGA